MLSLMSSNIFELWKTNGEVLPFAVRRDSWATTTHVVVERIEIKKWPYGSACGWVYRKGIKQPAIGESFPSDDSAPEISCAGCYQWNLVDGIPGMKNRAPIFPEKPLHIYSQGEVLLFGKFAGTPIETIVEQNPSYIKWALENVTSFAISPDLLDAHSPEEPDQRIGRKFKNLNLSKINASNNERGPAVLGGASEESCSQEITRPDPERRGV